MTPSAELVDAARSGDAGAFELPLDAAPGTPVTDISWLESFPHPSPNAHYLTWESVEPAFVAALQQLSAIQPAVQILHEVLGFSAAEVAEQFDAFTPSGHSALQRARRVSSGREDSVVNASGRREPSEEPKRPCRPREPDARNCASDRAVVRAAASARAPQARSVLDYGATRS